MPVNVIQGKNKQHVNKNVSATAFINSSVSDLSIHQIFINIQQIIIICY